MMGYLLALHALLFILLSGRLNCAGGGSQDFAAEALSGM